MQLMNQPARITDRTAAVLMYFFDGTGQTLELRVFSGEDEHTDRCSSGS